ncbi:MAG: acyltransferase family protein [Candidatus Dormibacteria bacterium]
MRPPTAATAPVVSAEPGFLPLIDCLRAVAAGVVVIHHTNDLANRPSFYPALVGGFGEWGVDIFFVLSAFLLCEYFWRPAGARPLRAFYTRRLFRIAPAYYAAILVLFVFFANHAVLFSPFGLRQVLASLSFTHYLAPATSPSLNVDGALWTLSIEMLLYLALPLMALLVPRRPWLAFAGMFALTIGYRLFIALSAEPIRGLYFGNGTTIPEGIVRIFLARQFPGFVSVFAVGILLRWVLYRNLLPARLTAPMKRPSTLVFVALLLPGALLLLASGRGGDYLHPAWFSLYDTAIALATLPVLLYASRAVTGSLPLVLRGGAWLGRRSYGLYLWHFPVILSVYGRGPLERAPQLSHFGVRLLLVAVISIGLAAASWTLVEKPAIAYASALVRKQRQVAA